MTRLSYLEKSKLQKNETCKAFLELVEAKKTNLCISVDVNKKEEFLNIIDTVGPYVCLVKVN
jgi:orotidine-5'-phosphate decarboxylase